MPLTLAPPPLATPLIEGPKRPFIAKEWANWLQQVVIGRLTLAPDTLTSIVLTGQAASIGITPLIPVASAGLYRVSYYARITAAASVSSSLVVTINSSDGVAIAQSSPAQTGNTTASVLSGVVVVRSDPATVIGYSTTYASVGAPGMAYSLSVVVERIAS